MNKINLLRDDMDARILFVDLWAEFVKNNPDEVWGMVHTNYINSWLKNIKHYPLNVKNYLNAKGEKCSRE